MTRREARQQALQHAVSVLRERAEAIASAEYQDARTAQDPDKIAEELYILAAPLAQRLHRHYGGAQ